MQIPIQTIIRPIPNQFVKAKSASIMRRISNERLKDYFLGWQCRIRQISARDYGGQPLPAMTPQVSSKKGEIIIPTMMSLLVPQDPGPATAYLRFQVQKHNEHLKARNAALQYLSADFYQLPELFTDEMTAVFGSNSVTAKSMTGKREVLLSFEQYSQAFRMFCKARIVGEKHPAREFSLWQARIFNPNIPNEATVLSFKPDWKNAVADPFPSAG